MPSPQALALGSFRPPRDPGPPALPAAPRRFEPAAGPAAPAQPAAGGRPGPSLADVFRMLRDTDRGEAGPSAAPPRGQG